MATTKTRENLVVNAKKWQELEKDAESFTSKIIEQTDNPVIRIVMEIINRDNHIHHRILQMIIDNVEKGHVSVSVDDLVKVWDSIEEHIKTEKKVISMAHFMLDELKGPDTAVPHYLLTYLLEDEQKHERLLQNLELIKQEMYP